MTISTAPPKCPEVLNEAFPISDLLCSYRASENGDDYDMIGSPFVEGQSVAVARAALLQCAAGAIAKAGGTIQSSQVDVEGSQGGMVKLQIGCEIGQTDLQRLLYDLEAGMLFLFVEGLTAEMPQAVGANDGIGRMHVRLTLSGEWQGAAR
jgi:general secretion pathway protein M